MHDDTKTAAPLRPEEELELRAAWACIGAWAPREDVDPDDTYECPLCNGEGETEGVILDATSPSPATLHPCGIGEGLRAAELVAGSTGRLLATLDQVRTERDALQVDLGSVRELLRAAREERDVAERSAEAARDALGRDIEAAPELYSALEDVVEVFSVHQEDEAALLARARSALSAARGER